MNIVSYNIHSLKNNTNGQEITKNNFGKKIPFFTNLLEPGSLTKNYLKISQVNGAILASKLALSRLIYEGLRKRNLDSENDNFDQKLKKSVF